MGERKNGKRPKKAISGAVFAPAAEASLVVRKRAVKKSAPLAAADAASAAPVDVIVPDLPALPAPVSAAVAEPAAALAVATVAEPLAAPAPTVTDEPRVPPAAEPIQKGFFTMATTFDTSKFGGERVQAMFGEMNERAKTAMEKSAKLAEDMTEFTKGNVEALVASTRVAAKGAESLTQDFAESARKQFETATATMKSFATAKSPTELFQLQSDYAKTYFDTLVAETSKMSESVLKLAGDVAQPLSSRFAVAAEKMKTPAL